MSLTAINSAGDAIDATREYLRGRRLRQWATLALMALFLGPAGVGGPPGPVEIDEAAFQDDGDLPTLGELADAIDIDLVLVAIGAIAVLAILYGLVSAFMEFGFVHSLSSGTVAIRAPARAHWPRALSLFVFRAVVWGLGVVGVSLLVADVLGVVSLPVSLDALGLWLAVVLGGGVLYLLNRLTTDFVVPIMYHEHRGLLSGWARLLGVMRRTWRQYAVYVPVRLILEVALGIAFGIVIAVAILAVAIVVGVPLGVVLVLALGVLPGVAITAVVIGLIGIVILALAMVPFHAYLRLYTLLVLGDTEADLDLVPAERERIRG